MLKYLNSYFNLYVSNCIVFQLLNTLRDFLYLQITRTFGLRQPATFYWLNHTVFFARFSMAISDKRVRYFKIRYCMDLSKSALFI